MAKKAIITAGGWDGHEPTQCAAVFKTVLEKEGYDVEVHETMDVFADADTMNNANLIVPIWTMGEISGEQESGLMAAVSSGVGLAGFHGGMCDAFRNNTNYQFMTGANWVSHPDNIKDYTVNITSDDPIVDGLSDFDMHSEQYYLHVDPHVEVLASTTFVGSEQAPWVNGCVMPVVYKKMWGEGRVFYSSLGHVASDFDVSEAKEIQRRGMLWAST
ncbi:MAG: ThuA domain-containing protein [Lentisphaeria bacterium]|nr:ThuA domain-containing protein [Lentisphaeria bacterium]NQZ66614.1 ThuA domain-containing protein [Lentisphaeria bacterium]